MRFIKVTVQHTRHGGGSLLAIICSYRVQGKTEEYSKGLDNIFIDNETDFLLFVLVD